MADLRLKEIHLKNVKVHKSLSITDIPENGFIIFSGPNSAGKSSVLDFLMDVLEGKLKSSDVRKDHISFNESSADGHFIFHNGLEIKVHITLGTAKESYYTFILKGVEPVRITVDDAMIDVFLDAHVNLHSKDNDSLNFHRTLESKLLFINTTPQETFKFIEGSLTDKSLEFAYSKMEEFVKTTRSHLITLKANIAAEERIATKELANIENLEVLRSNIIESRNIAEIIETAVQFVHKTNNLDELNIDFNSIEEFLALPEISIVEKLTNLNVQDSFDLNDVIEQVEINETPISFVRKAKLSAIDVDKIMNVVEKLNSSIEEYENMKIYLDVTDYNEAVTNILSINDGICPTCGKGLID